MTTPERDWNKGVIAWFAGNGIAANLLMIVIVVCGLASTFGIRKAVMPNFETNTIQVRIPYLGATPIEVEEGVILRVEEAIKDIQGIKRVRSTAFEGMGQVQIEVETDADVDDVLNDVKLRVDAIATLPGETENPIIAKVEFQNDVLWLSVYGDMDERARKELANEVRDELLALPEISAVTVLGARAYEIAIEVSEHTLREYGLTLDEVATAVRAASLDLPGGAIKTEAGDILLRTKGQAYTGQEFARVVLRSHPDGTRLLLGDIATIRDGFVETEGFSRFNGAPAVPIRIQATGEQNALDIDAVVKRYVTDKQARLPPGAHLEEWGNSAFYLQDRMDLMYSNMLSGGLLVFLLLTLFLRLRVAIWVVIGIPVAFLGALWLMPIGPYATDINVLSLFGFILVLGVVVDDATVIGESVYTEICKNGHSLETVVKGTRKVALPVTFGVLTTVAGFAPLLFVGGQVGPFFEAIAVVVILCLLFSLLESKLILPAHLVHTNFTGYDARTRNPLARFQHLFDSWLQHFINDIYRPLLEKAIAQRYTTLSLFIASLILAVGVVAGGLVKFEFFPNVPSDFVQVNLAMTDGTAPATRNRALDTLERAIREVDADYQKEFAADSMVQAVVVFSNGDTGGFLLLELTKPEFRQIDAIEVERRWRERVGVIPAVEELRFSSSTNTGGARLNLQLTGSDFDQLERAASELEARLAQYDGVYDINNSYRRGNREIQLRIKPEAEALGLSMRDMGRQVRQAFYGDEAQRIQRGRDEVRVMVRYPRDERESQANLENMRIRTQGGDEVPLPEVGTIEVGTSFATINRVNSRRAVTITAETDPEKVQSGDIVKEITNDFVPGLLARYPNVNFELEGANVEEEELMQRIGLLFGIGMLLIFGLLAIPLRSCFLATLILLVIPFGFVGAVIGHLLFGFSLSMMSMFGLVALAGVIINDSLVLLDFTNLSRNEGLSPIDAVMQAGTQRFRAIVLTTVTTFFGLFPIMFETSLQAQFLIPTTLSLGFGVVFGTLVTLFLVPAVYLAWEDLRDALRRRMTAATLPPDSVRNA